MLYLNAKVAFMQSNDTDGMKYVNHVMYLTGINIIINTLFALFLEFLFRIIGEYRIITKELNIKDYSNIIFYTLLMSVFVLVGVTHSEQYYPITLRFFSDRYGIDIVYLTATIICIWFGTWVISNNTSIHKASEYENLDKRLSHMETIVTKLVDSTEQNSSAVNAILNTTSETNALFKEYINKE
jgi:hypothetical protein